MKETRFALAVTERTTRLLASLKVTVQSATVVRSAWISVVSTRPSWLGEKIVAVARALLMATLDKVTGTVTPLKLPAKSTTCKSRV